MRAYGRVTDELGNKRWVIVQTDDQGNNQYVLVTALIQVLLLNLNESPFFGNYGIPAKNSVLQQIAPDFYILFTQQAYAGYFANLVITKESQQAAYEKTGRPTPIYDVSVTTLQGTKFQAIIPGETVPFPPAPYPTNNIQPYITVDGATGFAGELDLSQPRDSGLTETLLGV